jgi:hypothetical protein
LLAGAEEWQPELVSLQKVTGAVDLPPEVSSLNGLLGELWGALEELWQSVHCTGVPPSAPPSVEPWPALLYSVRLMVAVVALP